MIASITSKVLLVIEAVAISVLSIEGLIFSLSDLTSFASGSGGKDRVSFIDFPANIIILCALIFGWRIFAWVITNGPGRGTYISPVWWVFAGLGAFLTILSLGGWHELLGLPAAPLGVVAALDPIGLLFLIPFTHLIIEVIWQRRMPKSLQSTNGVGG